MNRTTRTLLALPAALVGLGLAATTAQASDLSFAFLQDTQQATVGTPTNIFFSGVLTNSSTTNRIYLNNDDFTFTSGPGLNATDVFPDDPSTYDPTTMTYQPNPDIPFSTDPNDPDVDRTYLLPGQSITIHNLFEIQTSSTTPLGNYTGSYNFAGGEDVAGGRLFTNGNDSRDAQVQLLTNTAGNPENLNNGSQIGTPTPVGFTLSVVKPQAPPPVTGGAVPEASSLSLMSLGLLGLGFIGVRRRAARA